MVAPFPAIFAPIFCKAASTIGCLPICLYTFIMLVHTSKYSALFLFAEGSSLNNGFANIPWKENTRNRKMTTAAVILFLYVIASSSLPIVSKSSDNNNGIHKIRFFPPAACRVATSSGLRFFFVMCLKFQTSF